MNSGGSQVPTSVEIARRLLARDLPPGREGKPEKVGAALQKTLARVSLSLRDSMGEDGYNALLARALARTEAQHPVLKDIRRLNDGAIHLEGVAASVEMHGVPQVTAAVEALLAVLLDVLGRLIGEDMAILIIDYDGPHSRKGGGANEP